MALWSSSRSAYAQPAARAQVETTFHGLNNPAEYVPVGVHKMWLYNSRDVVDALVRRGCPAIEKLMALGADYGQRHNHDSAAIAAMRDQRARSTERLLREAPHTL